jgi:hypothetical protein
VEKGVKVRIELPNGIGLSEAEIKLLIDDWIVPELIQAFIRDVVWGERSNRPSV